MLRDFLKKIDTPADLDRYSKPILSHTLQEDRKLLSELSDPRKNANYFSDQFGPEKDAYEIPESLMTDVIALRKILKFRYIDQKGQESRRTVELKEIQFYGSEGQFLYGECRMRREGRTFKTSRMWDIIDVETGEVIEDVSTFLVSAYKESVVGRLSVWFQEYERIGKAWLYLLKANKTPTKKEYDVLKNAFSEILNGAVVTTKDIQDVFEDATITTPIGFQRLVSGIKNHHASEAQRFVYVCKSIVEARSNPNFADEAALKYVLQKIPVSND